MANVFDKLGRQVLPKVFDKLSGVGLSDLMDVKTEVTAAGTKGGRIKSASVNVYEEIPVVFKPAGGRGFKVPQGDKLQSNVEYTITFATHDKHGARYDIDPVKHRLHVRARYGDSDEPAKVYRIISMKDIQGNLWEAVCMREY